MKAARSRTATLKSPRREIHAHIQGTYKKAKLKTLWFVSTCFKPRRYYSAGEVDLIIIRALDCLDQTGGSTEVSHVRSALCELKFLTLSLEGRRYWKMDHGSD